MFGHGVIFTQQHGRRLFNGVAHSRANADFIFIDVDSDKPVMGVLGHELLHRLRANRPDLYDSLRATLGTVLKDQASYGAVINAKRVAKNMEPLSDDVMTEELIADVVGDEFTEPDFWKALGDQQPKGFRKMAQAVLDFLNDVIHSVTKRRPFGTDKYLTDLKAARTAVADAIRQFSADEVGAATSAEDGFKLAVANGELRASSAPLDKVLQLAGGTLLARVTSPGYTKLLTWLDNAGERVVGKPYLYAKAGLQADYGLTPDYKQARSDLQTRIRKGTREAATVVEQLQTLDRAQSRIAYMWM